MLSLRVSREMQWPNFLSQPCLIDTHFEAAGFNVKDGDVQAYHLENFISGKMHRSVF